jgi:hypothetical protein
VAPAASVLLAVAAIRYLSVRTAGGSCSSDSCRITSSGTAPLGWSRRTPPTRRFPQAESPLGLMGASEAGAMRF